MNRKISILGSGLVSSAVVNFFHRNANKYKIIVGSKVSEELADLEKMYPAITTIVLDVTTDGEKLREIIENSHLVISLLTNEMHVPIARKCIKHRVHMIHASYCTKEMQELDIIAKENGVTILNEIGLDPGIDHFLAMKAIDEIHETVDAKVTDFISYCGGLPAPAISHCNPLRYKFSWSPSTALGNLLNSAKYLENNKVVEIAQGGNLLNAFKDVEFFPEFQLEGYPNRDSMVYKDLYGIHQATNLIRGTLRYRGFGKVANTLHKLSLLSLEPTSKDSDTGFTPHPESWKELLLKIVQRPNGKCETEVKSLETILLDLGYSNDEIKSLSELGLLSETKDVKLKDTLLDTLAEHLKVTLSFEPCEQDIVILRHEIRSKQPNGDEEVREIHFVEYGDQHIGGFSAMSKTVGLCIGYAGELLLSDNFDRRGVILPFTSDIYNPILKQLEREGISFVEKRYVTKS